VPEKSLEMRHFQASRIWRSQGRPLPGVPESLGMEEMGKNGSNGRSWEYNSAGQEA
jgi:hypothetical protein